MLLSMRTGRPLKPRATEFGQRLAEARQKAGLSQAEFGKRMGMSQRAIGNWETRESTSLRPDQIVQITEILGVTAEFLVTGEEPGKPKRPGPKGKLAEAFEQAAKLPRKNQVQIVDVLNALIAQAKTT